MEKIKISLQNLPNYFLKEDGTFDREAAIRFGGYFAGVCYNKEGYQDVLLEPEEKTRRRVTDNFDNRHHSVHGHVHITMNIENIPKILAMVLNNENEYNTSEKSARYTPIEKNECIKNGDSIITIEEVELYEKWFHYFQNIITQKYGKVLKPFKIKTLAQENARYMVSIFMPTKMIYTTSFRQINYIASWMDDYILHADKHDPFELKLSVYMEQFINQLIENNIIDERLLVNDKHRKLSLFGEGVKDIKQYFGDVYATKYVGSMAQLAQAQRHRTLDYQMQFFKIYKNVMSIEEEHSYFVPPIIQDDPSLVAEWLEDIRSVSDVRPQGELVFISEFGKYDDFILKCKERLCSAAQLEIMMQTRDTLLQYQEALVQSHHRLANDISKYTKGARCTFPGFECTSDCKFQEGKILKRKI